MNSTNFQVSLNKFSFSGLNNPCPICGRTKDKDCRIGENQGFVLCHTEINHRSKGEELSGFVYLGEDVTGSWGKWVAKDEQFRKERVVGQEFRFDFCDRTGRVAVTEVRKYVAGGEKSQWMEPSGVDSRTLVPYRYYECLEELQNGTPVVLVVEGPKKAEECWALGIPATTFCNGFQPIRDSKWFPGYEARLVIVPDQDLVGVKKADNIAKAYPMAKGWRPWSESLWWDSDWLPENGGKGLEDWIQQQRSLGLTQGEIAEQILNQPKPVKQPQVNLTEEEEDLAAELDRLLEISKRQAPDILPEFLAEPFKFIANRFAVPVGAIVNNFLSVAASQINAGTRLELDRSTNFKVPPVHWSGQIGITGSKKSPSLDVVMAPLVELQAKAESDYQGQMADYETKLQNWEEQKKQRNPNAGTKPVQPTAIEHYLSDFTMESVSSVVSAHPDRGLVISVDELRGFFDSMDAYRERGGDRQKWLSFYGGGQLKINRKGSARVFVPKTSISIMGGIQPNILKRMWDKDESIEDGLWSRFAWVEVPLVESPGIGQGVNYSLGDRLKYIYQNIHRTLPTTYTISAKGVEIYNKWHYAIEKLILNEMSPFLRATYPKMRERAMRIALILHEIYAAIDGVLPGPQIADELLDLGIKFTLWLMAQTRSIYANFGITDNAETAKIKSFVERFDGRELTLKQVRAWSPGRSKWTMDKCREFVAQLIKFGKATENGLSGKDYRFTVTSGVTSMRSEVTSSVTSKVTSLTSGDLHEVTSGTIADKGIEPSVTSLTSKNQESQKQQEFGQSDLSDPIFEKNEVTEVTPDANPLPAYVSEVTSMRSHEVKIGHTEVTLEVNEVTCDLIDDLALDDWAGDLPPEEDF